MKYPTILILLISFVFFGWGQAPDLVFSTASFTSGTDLEFNNEHYQITFKKECEQVGDPPLTCQTRIQLAQKEIKSEVVVSGRGYAFCAADINQDGNDDLMVLSAEGGNWRMVHTLAIRYAEKSGDAHWFRPIGPFLWWPGYGMDDACDAELFWKGIENEVLIRTTNAGDENFNCSDEEIFKWNPDGRRVYAHPAR